MKTNIILYSCLALAVAIITACDNQDKEFPDFAYQTVYFANPYYVRTIELGEDPNVDNSIDNEHKFRIMAVMGGVYKNKQNRIIDFKVDESLCENLYFNGPENPVIPMPSSYYQLAANQITIPTGNTLGGVEVQLTDAFFDDPLSLSNNYAIPLVMTNVQGADSILQGRPQVDYPDRCIDAHWTVKPQDYVICVVKYVNPWHANYLRRGIDQITGAEGTHTEVRHAQYVENNPEVSITTSSLTRSVLPLTIQDDGGNDVHYELQLAFDSEGTCTVSGSDNAYEVTGSGKFVSKGEKNSIGGQDRDALYLDYSVQFKNLNLQYSTKDTLVVKNRGIVPEYFTVVKFD